MIMKYSIFFRGTNCNAVNSCVWTSADAAQKHINEYAVFPGDYEVRTI